MPLSVNKRLKILSEQDIGLLLEQEPTLALEYEALCIRLIALLKSPYSASTPLWLQQTLTDAQTFNDVLFKVYQKSQPSRAHQLNHHQQFFRKIAPRMPSLETPDTRPASPQIPTLKPASRWERIRLFISGNNLFRLMVARMRRTLRHLETLLKLLSHPNDWFYGWYNTLDTRFFGPIMNIFSWLFLLPRMLINLFYLVAKTFYPESYAEHAQELNWRQRFLLEWRERWYELANDMVWVPGGILTCFVLVGSYSTSGAILGIALFGWDLVMNLTRATLELTRINRLISIYEAMTPDLDKHAQEHHAFIDQLKQHRWFEIKRHGFIMANNSLVLICSFLAVNLLNLPIAIPLIAAVSLVVLSILAYTIMPRINQSRPQAVFDASLPSNVMSTPSLSIDDLAQQMNRINTAPHPLDGTPGTTSAHPPYKETHHDLFTPITPLIQNQAGGLSPTAS